MANEPTIQRSAPELEFLRRWRPMIDRVGGDGGQKRAAKHLNWATSTVSRDYKGHTLPTEERLHQLCSALQLSPGETLELTRLLRRARSARNDRVHAPVTAEAAGAVASGQEHAGQPGPAHQPRCQPGHATLGLRNWLRGGRGRLAAVVGVAAAVAAAVSLSGSGTPPFAVRGAFPGLTLDSVSIPVRSLSPSLAAAFRQGKTAHEAAITGFVFRNAMDTSLCLTAVNSGPTAGNNRDAVVVSNCRQAADQIWIPEQWETQGSRFTHLVNDQYQTKCLNAARPVRNGRVVQLWDCYPAQEELWDFGDWHRAVGAGGVSYPLLAWSSPQCLDADKYDFREGTRVHVWTQYATRNQFWS